MSATLPILQDIRQRLLDKVDRYEVDLFPDDADKYRLNAQDGAILVQYVGSKFEGQGALEMVHQRRQVRVLLSVISRSLNDDAGALAMLDEIRLAVAGFKPTNCSAINLVEEFFESSDNGLWLYQLLLQTSTMQVQVCEPSDGVPYVGNLVRQKGEPTVDISDLPKQTSDDDQGVAALAATLLRRRQQN